MPAKKKINSVAKANQRGAKKSRKAITSSSRSTNECNECEQGSERINEEPSFEYITQDEGNREMLALAQDVESHIPEGEQSRASWPCTVQGRLGMTGAKRGKTYLVTKAEVFRRVGYPEHMSSTGICQYLKRGRDKANLPRDIIVPHKRKSKDSLFSLLTEGETEDLASDFGQILSEEKYFQTLCSTVDSEDTNTIRTVIIKLLEQMGNMRTNSTNTRTHGFVEPVMRMILKGIHDSVQH